MVDMGAKSKIVMALFSLFFSVMNIGVWKLDEINKGYLEGEAAILIAFINIMILWVVSYSVMNVILQYDTKKLFDKDIISEKKSNDLRKYGVIVSLSQFAAWLPVFLAYWPGLFEYDAANQLAQWVTKDYSTHHPLVHTLYLQFFYFLFDDYDTNYGIVAATLTQMLLFSVMLTSMQLFLYRCRVKKKIRLIILAITCFSPYFSMLSISMTKDTLYAGFVCVFFSCLTWICMQQNVGRKVYLSYVLSVLGVVTFRNNGIYGISAITIVLVIQVIRKKGNQRLLISTLIGLLGACLMLTGLKLVLHAKNGSSNEALSIPYQQLACVYHSQEDELDEATKIQIRQIIPDVEKYIFYCSDQIKGSAKGMEYKKEFIALYIRLGLKYPQTYIKAFLVHDAGYFNIADDTFAEIYGVENRQGIFPSGTKEGFKVDVSHKTYFPALENLYEYLYTTNHYQDIILFKWFLSPAFYLWCIALAICIGCLRGNKRPGILVAYLAVSTLTILAGPCVLARYILAFMVCIPQLYAYVYMEES